MQASNRPRLRAIRIAALAVATALTGAGLLAAPTPPPTGCGGGALGPAHDRPNVVCEDFDRDRNGSGSIEWTRRYLAASACDPLRGVTDPGDDILGHVVNGGAVPFGTDGQICSTDSGFAQALLTCHVVDPENDWHLHSATEGCGAEYDGRAEFASSCAPEPRAHSGFRSLHLGRHLNATDTLYDTYRFRQVSAFVMDPLNLGNGSTLEFWHIIQVCDDKCVNAGAGATTAGGQVQISLLDGTTGTYERWQRLSPTENGYNSVDQEIIVVCEFDPGDDQLPPLDETMCGGAPQWSDIGDLYGNDRTCTVDEDGNDPVDKDCGETTNRTVDTSCSWVADPSCGSFLENGTVGRGVWARSRFNLSPFSSRTARLRWIAELGGGWGFGMSASFLEPQPTHPPTDPSFVYDQDDGWYIDDIRVAGVRKNATAAPCD